MSSGGQKEGHNSTGQARWRWQPLTTQRQLDSRRAPHLFQLPKLIHDVSDWCTVGDITDSQGTPHTQAPPPTRPNAHRQGSSAVAGLAAASSAEQPPLIPASATLACRFNRKARCGGATQRRKQQTILSVKQCSQLQRLGLRRRGTSGDGSAPDMLSSPGKCVWRRSKHGGLCSAGAVKRLKPDRCHRQKPDRCHRQKPRLLSAVAAPGCCQR